MAPRKFWKNGPGNAISFILASNSALNIDSVSTVTTQMKFNVESRQQGFVEGRQQNSLVAS